jgi:heme A synthase
MDLVKINDCLKKSMVRIGLCSFLVHAVYYFLMVYNLILVYGIKRASWLSIFVGLNVGIRVYLLVLMGLVFMLWAIWEYYEMPSMRTWNFSSKMGNSLRNQLLRYGKHTAAIFLVDWLILLYFRSPWSSGSIATLTIVFFYGLHCLVFIPVGEKYGWFIPRDEEEYDSFNLI